MLIVLNQIGVSFTRDHQLCLAIFDKNNGWTRVAIVVGRGLRSKCLVVAPLDLAICASVENGNHIAWLCGWQRGIVNQNVAGFTILSD